MIKKIIHLVIPAGIVAILIPLFISRISAANSTSKSFTKPEQVGPPWYDAAWSYRRPVIIINPGTTLSYYQVLITLDSDNFDFSQANADGSDIRFTHSDGTTELNYWIEAWSSTEQMAYVWVRIPSLASGDTTIFLYYKNPAASLASNGATTFDGFDTDWTQFTNQRSIHEEETNIAENPAEIESPFNWIPIAGSPAVTSGILNLDAGTGIKSSSTYRYFAMGMRANFGNGTGREWGGFINEASGQRAMIGDLPTDPDDLYLINYRTSIESLLIPRVGGIDWHNAYHVYEVRWESDQTKADIDHGAKTAVSTQPLQVPNTVLPVTLYSYTGSNATLKVDWVYTRMYREPEPTFTIGVEQGLVDLKINASDSPDPLQANVDLTYQLTITNTSTLAASGVVVTDTLPASTQLSSANPSQGFCSGSNEIVCNLGTIPANLTANVTIIVTPTLGGVITNTVIVGSLGYELNTTNNIADTTTLVDTIDPYVNWEKPAHNGQDYRTYGGLITLEASATDNDQIAWVQFYLWDHLSNTYIFYDPDYSYPYQMQFNSDILQVNEIYQLLVHAADRAGNVSDPGIIWIQRKNLYFQFLPMAVRK